MKTLISAALFAATAMTASAASAVVVNLRINTALSGTFANVAPFDGRSVLTGTFEFNQVTQPSGAALNNFHAPFTPTGSNVTTDFTVGNGVTIQYDGTNLNFFQGGSTIFSFLISNLVTANGLQPAYANTTTNASSFNFNGAQVDINAGSLGKLSATASVPEPAAWALMIGGFGMIGGTLRYRRRSTKVSFA